MSASLIAGCLWVLAAVAVAFLPMRRQFAPGIVPLFAAPVLLAWTAWDHGGWAFAFGSFAFLSMVRNPLLYVLRRARGAQPELPS